MADPLPWERDWSGGGDAAPWQQSWGKPAPAAPSIDRDTGAPPRVRAIVGIERTPQARLAALQRFYPDAKPEGDDNFVYTDPQSGKQRLYNDEGVIPSMGDIASIGPEISEFVGGAGGAAAVAPVAAGAAPATGGASLYSLPLAYGLGATGARELYENLVRNLLSGNADERSLGHHLAETVMTAAVNTGGQAAGQAIVEGVKKVATPLIRKVLPGVGTSQSRLADFDKAGVTPDAGAVTGNRAVQMVQSGLTNTPGGAAVMQKTAEKQLQELAGSVDNLAQQFGGGKASTSGQRLGETFQSGAKKAGERFAQQRQRIDDQLEQKIGPGTVVPVSNVTAEIQALEAEIAKAPNTLEPILGAARDQLKRIAADAQQTGGIPFSILRKARTALGAQLERPDVAGYTPGSEAALRKAYGILSEDIKGAAAQAGPEAARLLKQHDRYVRFNRNINLNVLDDIAKKDRPGEALNYAMSGAREDGTRLAKLRRNYKPEEWDIVSGSVLQRLGRAKPGQQGATDALTGEGETFSVASFLTNFNSLAPEARSALFGGTRYKDLVPDLNRLVRVADALKDAQKVANPSGTARNLSTQLWLMSAAGAFPTAVVTGNISASLAAGAVSSGSLVVAPYYGAKLMTSPRFVRWLAGSSSPSAPYSPMTAKLSRLYAIAETEPEIAEAVNEYVKVLEASRPQ